VFIVIGVSLSEPHTVELYCKKLCAYLCIHVCSLLLGNQIFKGPYLEVEGVEVIMEWLG